ncbi:MAG TPA: RNA polymerase factor sigma-54 [Afifellaceae bacterium]|nr:RNA polymerase factor sigma-54 [Afifellaceae bacterium]
MALTAKLQVRQQQSLTMTPQLMQAIRLLQMSAVELDRFVEEELNSNPLLARSDERAPEDVSDPAGPDDGVASGAEPPDLADVSDIMGSERPRGSADLDVPEAFANPDADAAGRDPLPYRAAATTWSGQGEFTPDLEATLSERPSLTAFIENQINARIGDQVDRAIALALLSHLDAAGYLTVPLVEVAEALSVPESRVEVVLGLCQTVEPTGVFARSLGECLALQLAERNRLDPAIQVMLDNLHMLANGSHTALQRLCNVSAEDFAEMLAEIKALDPKPGLAYTHEPVALAIADIIVRERADGGWAVELNDEVLPRVLVDRRYHAELTGHGGAQDLKFIADCMQQASWLEKSLDQRARTILKVATEIVAQQDAFLRHGVVRLRPLNLRAVADAIGVHESTVSRATANKYMATPRGLFELKFFFSTAIASNADEAGHSAEAVKHRIRKLVDAEAPDAILSDDAIVDLLGREGIVIARRTVAKYRDILKIPSSVQRRRQKRPVPVH